MFRKALACLMLVAAFATAVGVVPGILENVALANCNPSDPTCS